MTPVIAVTGATGFVGRNLVAAHLAAGDEVRVLSRRPASDSRVRSFVADLADVGHRQLEPFIRGADVLYHCAAELRDESRMHDVQVEGTTQLLLAAEGKLPRWVQLSSVGVYGPVRRGVVTEHAELRPVGPYETTKAQSDDLVMEWSIRTGTTAVVLRPSIVIGVDMPSGWLASLLTAIERGRFAFIGRPGASANYLPIGELVEALIRCGQVPLPQLNVFNLSQWLTMEEFVHGAAKRLKAPSPSLRIPAAAAHLVAGTLGWAPGFPLTRSRVAALTSFVRYSSSRISRVTGHIPNGTVLDELNKIIGPRR